jgi:bifunctional ADP-heptose synthase (sugar kinase/adenylyltransferase)
MDDAPLTAGLQRDVDDLIGQVASKADVVIVTDFGHGLLAESSVRVLGAAASFMAVNTKSNSANMGFNLITKYPKADFVCIDAPEARLAVSDRNSSVGDIAHRIVNQIDCPRIIITHGKHGCLTHERGQTVHSIPAVARQGHRYRRRRRRLPGGDRTPGGCRRRLDRIGFIGNVVGALKVEIVDIAARRQAIAQGITG